MLTRPLSLMPSHRVRVRSGLVESEDKEIDRVERANKVSQEREIGLEVESQEAIEDSLGIEG